MPRGTILVVDDSPLTVEAVRQGLEADGFTVQSASDLADIPRPLRAHGVDLVLLDVEMAEAFGDDLASILRAGDEAGPPIYLLSALEDEELSDRAASAEVDGFIRKRDGVAQVVARVHAILGDVAESVTVRRPDLLPQFRESAVRRTRHARAALRVGDRDHLRQVGYELHALVGEAAVLGYPTLAARAQVGRRAAAAYLEAPGPETRRACEDVLAAIEEEVAAMDAIASPRPATVPGANGRRVLLVDDSDVYRATMRAILEDSGYQVVEAASLAEARERIGGMACELAILDVELGDGSGVELIPAIRAAMPRVAVVVMSGGDAMTLTDAADLVLLKTLDPTSVLVKLDRLLGGGCG